MNICCFYDNCVKKLCLYYLLLSISCNHSLFKIHIFVGATNTNLFVYAVAPTFSPHINSKASTCINARFYSPRF